MEVLAICPLLFNMTGVYELLNRNTCITEICILLVFCVNSDGRLITHAERKSMASGCVVLQHHSWVVQVIITSRHGFAWLYAVTQELGSESEARFVTCFTPLAVGSGSVRGSVHCCQH